jgi:alkanesulfonate monooxygenase SsuD/methylene tetrahydromethanopterin reductase-like flavin-dependent oxidoreductase (luciferase family)
MEFALMLEPQAGGSYDELLGLARWAEDQGLAAIARSDHYLNGPESAEATDALTTLAGLARDTSRIKLTVLVTPLTFRHPAVIAKTAATIDQMSGGRLELGVGTGWMESEHEQFGMELPDLRTRFSLLYEHLAYLWAAFGRSEPGFTGRHFELAPIEVKPRPTGDLPIIIGGSGMKKTPTYAGRFADEYNMFYCSLDVLAERRAVMVDAAREAGRDPDAIRISMAGPIIAASDAAEHADMLAEMAADRDTTADELRARLDDRNVPHGTFDQVRSHLADLEAAGVSRLYLQRYEHLSTVDTAALERTLGPLRA